MRCTGKLDGRGGDELGADVEDRRAGGGPHHGNIVESYDAGMEEGELFIAMELLVGTSLEDEVRERGPLELCRGLERRPIHAATANRLNTAA